MRGLKRCGVSLRARALQKLCEVSGSDESPLSKLINSLPIAYSSNISKLYSIPLTLKEFEIIVAICDTAPKDFKTVESIINSVVRPYFASCSKQKFTDVVLSRARVNGFRNPLEVLSYKITLFLMRATAKFPSLAGKVDELFDGYLQTITSSVEVNTLVSFLGYMEAISDGLKKTNRIAEFHWKTVFRLIDNLNSDTLVKADTVLSRSVSNDILVNYFDNHREICALSFVHILTKIQVNLLTVLFNAEDHDSLSQYLLSIQNLEYQEETANTKFVNFKHTADRYCKELNKLTSAAEKIVSTMDDGAPYMSLQTYDTVSLAYACKISNMEILTFALFIDEPESAILSTRLISICSHEVDTLQATIRMENPALLKSVVNISSLLNFYTDRLSSRLLNAFPIVVSSQHISTCLVTDLSANFAIGLKPLSEDCIVGTIYSLNNLLAVTKDGSPVPLLKERKMTISDINELEKMFPRQRKANTFTSLNEMRMYLGVENNSNSSSSSLFNKTVEAEEKTLFDAANAHYHDQLFKNAVMACVTVARFYGDQSISALAITILTQKFRVLSTKSDKLILEGLAHILPFVADNEFKMLCKFYNSVSVHALKEENDELLDAVLTAREIISEELKHGKKGTSYIYYLRSILEIIVSRGDVEKLEHHRSHREISKVAEQIAFFLKPLALLLPVPGEEQSIRDILSTDAVTTSAFRNIWFNMVIHGFHRKSDLASNYRKELEIIAYNSPPLISDFPSNNKEATLEMNTILRRGSSNHNLKAQKTAIQQILSSNVIASKTISTTKIMFLAASFFLEGIRSDVGDCSTILEYFSDSTIVNTNLDKFLGSIAVNLVHTYLKAVPSGDLQLFSAKQISSQLKQMFLMLTHRDIFLQDCSFQCCDIFIKKLPSSLCHHDSLYALLDTLTMLFDSVSDFETRKYDPRFEFTLRTSGIKVLLTDSEDWRKSTFERLVITAKEWTKMLLRTSNQDGKILLQSYITDVTDLQNTNSVEYGVSFALEMAGTILSADRELSKIGYSSNNIKPNSLSGFLSQHAWRSKILTERSTMSSAADINMKRKNLKNSIVRRLVAKEQVDDASVTDFLSLCGVLLMMGQGESASLIYDLVSVPFQTFHGNTMKVATNVWLSFIKERKDLAHLLVSEISSFWCKSIDDKFGLYNKSIDKRDVEFVKMEYKPYDMDAIKKENARVNDVLKPHLHVIRFFESHFEATVYESDHLLKLFTHVAFHGVSNLEHASLHPFARIVRHELIRFAMLVLVVNEKKNTSDVKKLAQALVKGALSWFKVRPTWPLGGNETKIKADLSLMIDLYQQMKNHANLLVNHTGNSYVLLEYFMLNEVFQLRTWLKPFEKHENGEPKLPTELVSHAFNLDCQLAVNLCERYNNESKYTDKLGKLIRKNPVKSCHVHHAMPYLLKDISSASAERSVPHEVVYWVPVSPLSSINLFLPPWNRNKYLLQYNLRALESHDVENTFFYVPQIVQCLRHDEDQYVARFILDTAKISLQFSHQIIWNMLANEYQDDEASIEDPIKPTLERIRGKMIETYDDEAKQYYEREFTFFNDVTGISGKLKPYIRKTKAEKKAKIDEEMSNIVVQKDVYLPSNPEGIVVDIDRKSGKPLQSHAKAPFMATFRVKKDHEEESWQSAIFKVGDDCRQDVLALQLISLFRSIWQHIGLDVYVFPYRVTATAPGCGVIDVLPNSISRDMLGREAVNGLYEYFISKFGNESTIEFQRARNNFVKSLAAYSVISYLLQFKDRHNGNIMYDAQGHCLHIDFGFIFDIVPGGVKFEAVPFKLTKEMVKVMGGSQHTQAFSQFEDLCVATYLGIRPYMNVIIDGIVPMLESSLPCFKAQKTIKNLRGRFVPGKSPQEAAQHMRQLIRKSYESMFTKGYDEFQRLTNGIPY
ncbi:unnamed protein product [Kluyveromyces dobzhanskii CBS 2104]|uniref:1-phosphatidylinositol 4-kinase n=1 Tax=Kluyveromyces dobzhanskii CBS 2104 TaxID=1427455 RepID=A0A0A8L2S1_9SACH|nr:unnamed protein product [Kluyveromyces dobzhanskii CBS 2104]